MKHQMGVRGGRVPADAIRLEKMGSPGKAHKIPGKAPGTTNNVYVRGSRSEMHRSLGHKK